MVSYIYKTYFISNYMNGFLANVKQHNLFYGYISGHVGSSFSTRVSTDKSSSLGHAKIQLRQIYFAFLAYDKSISDTGIKKEVKKLFFPICWLTESGRSSHCKIAGEITSVSIMSDDCGLGRLSWRCGEIVGSSRFSNIFWNLAVIFRNFCCSFMFIKKIFKCMLYFKSRQSFISPSSSINLQKHRKNSNTAIQKFRRQREYTSHHQNSLSWKTKAPKYENLSPNF